MTKTSNPKDLCLELATSDNPNDVKKILKDNGYWDDTNCWRYLGDKENAFGTINNQQSEPINALIEKFVNSGDAILTSKAKEAGIDPEGPNAPQSMIEAKENFLNIPSGNLFELDDVQRRTLSDECGGVCTTGTVEMPNYAIYDFGEGQSPENFPTTLCGLSESNKIKIPFVQGKYCQGATGALSFCEEGLQLIVSRKSPKVRKNESDEIGFTIMRKFPAGNDANPSYRYLVDKNTNEVLRFPATSLKILPKRADLTSAYVANWEYGCFIKLYGFKMSQTLRSEFNTDLTYRLSVHLPSPVFPIRFYERRAKALAGAGNTPEISMNGLLTRLDNDRGSQVEDNMPIGIPFNVDGQQFNAEIYVLKEEVTSQQLRRWHGDNGLLFVVNGQVNGFHSKDFYTRKSVNLSYLKDKVITIVDCTSMSNDHHAEFFQADRERLKRSPFTNKVISEIEKLIGANQALKILQDQHRSKAIQNKVSNNKPLNDVVQNILLKNNVLNNILLKGLRLSNPHSSGLGNSGPWKSCFHPTYFDLDPKSPKTSSNKPRNVEQDRTADIIFHTDAPNDFFTRAIDKGSYDVYENNIKIANKPIFTGYNGVWHLHINLNKANYPLNKINEFRIEIHDINQALPFEHKIWIKTIPFRNNKASSSKSKSHSPGKVKGNSNKGSKNQLPPVFDVEKKDWSHHNWNKESYFTVKQNNKSYDTFVNIDNVYLLTELKAAKNNADRELIKNQFKAAAAIFAFKMCSDDQKNLIPSSLNLEDYCNTVAPVAAPIIIPLIQNLGSLSD